MQRSAPVSASIVPLLVNAYYLRTKLEELMKTSMIADIILEMVLTATTLGFMASGALSLTQSTWTGKSTSITTAGVNTGACQGWSSLMCLRMQEP